VSIPDRTIPIKPNPALRANGTRCIRQRSQGFKPKPNWEIKAAAKDTTDSPAMNIATSRGGRRENRRKRYVVTMRLIWGC